MHIPETWKSVMFIYLLQHRNPNFFRQSFIFSSYQNQVCLHNEQEKFGKKQSAILRLIKTLTKFSNVIGYHQTDLGTYKIHEKITRVWLAENGCIFHVTRVQSCNTSTNYNKHARCLNFFRLRCVFRINYQQEATWFLVRYGVTKHL